MDEISLKRLGRQQAQNLQVERVQKAGLELFFICVDVCFKKKMELHVL